MLHWDAAAIMPAGGARARAEQLATLRVIAHEELTAPELDDLVVEAERRATRSTHGSAPICARSADAGSTRRRCRVALSRPSRALVPSARRCGAMPGRGTISLPFCPSWSACWVCSAKSPRSRATISGRAPYEALLDQYEPGGSVATIDRLFDQIAAFLPDLLEAVLTRQAALPPPPAPAGPFPVDLQRRVGMRLMERIGFDFAHGRLDASAHPFCGGTPDDVRITTRYDENDFARALMAVLHETGHALYQRGLPDEWRLQPVGRARGMAMHESQSLLLEMQVCRSPAFMAFRRADLARGICVQTGRAGKPTRSTGGKSGSSAA